MRPIRIMTCALMLSAASVGAQPAQAPVAQAVQAVDLSGLWKAERRFGPDAVGRLIVSRSGGAWTADMAGHLVPVRSEAGALAFDLPGDRGAFRGRLDDGLIRGHWVRPPTPANSTRYATPVVLRPEGSQRWSGEVATLQDSYTFFLSMRGRPDGSFDAVLRNPDRDIGTQIGARRLVRDGEGLRLMGGRGNGPERLLANGRYDGENQSFTLVFPNRGGTYDFARDGDDSYFYPRGRTPGRYAYRPPPPRADGWRVGTLAEAGIDRAAIERLVQTILERPMDSTDAPQIHALLIARYGRLVLEEYFHGDSRETLHDTRSASKSIAAVTIGAAMRAGAPLRLSSPVYQVMNQGAFPAGLEPRKQAMTLEHLLTMSGGWFCDDGNDAAPGNEEVIAEQTAQPDWYLYTLAVPMATPPGENSVYCSSSPNVALGMLDRATGRWPIEAFDRLVARPMGIDHYAWPLDPVGHAYGGGGVRIRARDFIRFGQLMLNGGTWNGRRILDPAFAAAATSAHYHLAHVYYGYLWWVEDLPYKERIVRSYSARGAGGQVVTVVPELDLVVATMAGNYASRIQITYTGPIVPRSILPAVRERGDDPNAPVTDRAFDTPYGRSTDGSRVSATARPVGP